MYLQIKFEFRSGPLIFSGVTALELRILTVFRTFLCYGWTYREHFWCIALSWVTYRLSSNFVPVCWFLVDLLPLNLQFSQFSGLFWPLMDILRIYLICSFGQGYLQIKFEFPSDRIDFLMKSLPLNLNFDRFPDFSLLWMNLSRTFLLVCSFVTSIYRSSSNFVPVRWFSVAFLPLNLEFWWFSGLFLAMDRHIEDIFGM